MGQLFGFLSLLICCFDHPQVSLEPCPNHKVVKEGREIIPYSFMGLLGGPYTVPRIEPRSTMMIGGKGLTLPAVLTCPKRFWLLWFQFERRQWQEDLILWPHLQPVLVFVLRTLLAQYPGVKTCAAGLGDHAYVGLWGLNLGWPHARQSSWLASCALAAHLVRVLFLLALDVRSRPSFAETQILQHVPNIEWESVSNYPAHILWLIRSQGDLSNKATRLDLGKTSTL